MALSDSSVVGSVKARRWSSWKRERCHAIPHSNSLQHSEADCAPQLVEALGLLGLRRRALRGALVTRWRASSSGSRSANCGLADQQVQLWARLRPFCNATCVCHRTACTNLITSEGKGSETAP